MTIQQLIDEQMKEFDKLLEGGRLTLEGNGITPVDVTQEIKFFISSYTRKLIEAVGEEIGAMGHNLHTDFHTDYSETQRLAGRLEGYNAAISDVVLKLKEIINSLK